MIQKQLNFEKKRKKNLLRAAEKSASSNEAEPGRGEIACEQRTSAEGEPSDRAA